ncbi:hypothetical protein K431DRAFT_342915 [Polychaeton citri CBS 116435]|uniref:Uncharacterized protein n=1 Tax=Polychaeton citri CBS 116435 TaxID=1314669 RepID=A0A9P4QGQ6_9PEZI|nr:hypothetical protein K431DRAFT_342915 [Polychaeton citri CBS 116435]
MVEMSLNPESPKNYLGATIFWLYIIAALAFTAVTLQTLYRLKTSYHHHHHAPKAQYNAAIRAFSILAGISFTSLSFNMMHVLVQSFMKWCRNYDCLDTSVPSQGWLQTIWEWSVQSMQFQDFGEAIVANPARQLWTIAALANTLGVCIFIGFNGRQQQVPRLWAFFCLAEILPISFAENLFYLALLLKVQPVKGDAANRDIKNDKTLEKTPTLPVYDSLSLWYLPLYLATGFCIGQASRAAGTSHLIPIIFAARLVLLTPLSTWLHSSWGSVPFAVLKRFGHSMHINRLLGLIMCMLPVVGLRQTRSLDVQPLEALEALFEHPAVSTLGCDLVVSILGSVVWTVIAKEIGIHG